MTSNFLMLNEAKTEFLLIGSKQQLGKLDCPSTCLHIGGAEILPSESARNLGVIMDSTMSMDAHIASVSRACFYNIFNISRVRHYLDSQTCKMLMHCLVTTRLDYCNSLYANLPSKSIQKLQRIQNSAARCISRSSRYDHISPVLQSLHWLPVSSRITFKLLVLTHDCLHNENSPSYLKEHISPYTPQRTLRSCSDSLLTQPKSKTSMGDRAFSASAPHLWNELPLSIRNVSSKDHFKTLLKTHLFQQAFDLLPL